MEKATISNKRDRQLLALLRFSLGVSMELETKPTAAEWAALYEESVCHSLPGVTFDGVNRLRGANCPPLETVMQWAGDAEGIHEHENMRIKEGFVLREVCGDPVIMAQGLSSVDFGRLLGLSESASWLWNEALRQGEFTVESLANEYEISREQAHKDVKDIIEQMTTEGVVEL